MNTKKQNVIGGCHGIVWRWCRIFQSGQWNVGQRRWLGHCFVREGKGMLGKGMLDLGRSGVNVDCWD